MVQKSANIPPEKIPISSEVEAAQLVPEYIREHLDPKPDSNVSLPHLVSVSHNNIDYIGGKHRELYALVKTLFTDKQADEIYTYGPYFDVAAFLRHTDGSDIKYDFVDG